MSAPPDPAVESLLADLVAFPTVSDRPVTALAARLAQEAEDAGFTVTRFDSGPDKCNVVARIGPADAEGLVLSGHMDVVPTDGQAWTSDPFRLARRDDAGEARLYARGACDMKGFIAAACTALRGLDLRKLDRELVLVWTHDEEVGCHGSRVLVDRLEADGLTLPSLAIIGEPTDFRICRAHPGHTTMRIRCHGRPAHSSRPQLGASAIMLAADVLAALQRLQDRLAAEPQDTDPLVLAALPSPYPVLNCGHIHGGTAVNIVPEHCELLVGIRQLPGQEGADLVARVADAVAEVGHAWAARGGRVDTTLMHEAPAMLTPAGTTLERLLGPHAADPAPTAVPFATDGGNLQRAGVRSLVFGPGSIDVAHKADEYIPVAQLHRCVDVLRQVVVDRCGARPR